MGLPGIQTWACTLLVCLSWRHEGRASAGPQYMVVHPAVLEAGVETRFCASLLRPNESLVMTVTLKTKEENRTLLEKMSDEDFHTCFQFQAPAVKNKEVQMLEVTVQGETFYSKEVRKVLFQTNKPIVIVQTDKPIYLPGQTVHFRVLSLDTMLRSALQTYDIIELKDAKKNRIGQWLNQTSDSKILQLSYSLNPEASEGDYSITVKTDEKEMKHDFKVEAYVLPKYDVQINTLNEIRNLEKDLSVDVCAKYTFGQPVPGRAELKICNDARDLPYYAHLFVFRKSCRRLTKEMNPNGCATFNVRMSHFVTLARIMHFVTSRTRNVGQLDFEATVTETGTGISYTQRKTTKVLTLKIIFIDTPVTYVKGSILEAKIKAVFSNNSPVAGMDVTLQAGNVWRSTVKTDGDGIAAFSLNTSNFQGEIHLTVKQKDAIRYGGLRWSSEAPHHTVLPADSVQVKPYTSFTIRMKNERLTCDAEETISIQYTINGEGEGAADVIHLVLSRGSIIMQGVNKIDLKNQTEGDVSFQVKMSPDTTPKIQVAVYVVLPSGKLLTKNAEFPTEMCFNHKVSLEFSPSSAVPGEHATMHMTAQPDSLCGVNIVDQSVFIKEPGKTLDADKVLNLLHAQKKLTHVLIELEDQISCPAVSWLFWDLGLKAVTNLLSPCRIRTSLHYRKHSLSRARFGKMLHSNSPDRLNTKPPPPIETIRSFFPETWIWDLVQIGGSGRTDVSVKVPDTITTWETEAFCLSPQGFGLAPRQNLTVFQPFFLELTMPYSMIRGENFELKATVFNYLSSCIMVSMTPALSSDYTLTPISSDQYTSCLCGNERKTLSWTMTPSTLGNVNVSVRAEAVSSSAPCGNEIVEVPERGRIDVVTRSLIVKAEGTEVSKTFNWFLCPKDNVLTEETELQLPWNLIEGSARASVSVLGDVLGRALKNLDKLLAMPFGCGEQNMVLLAPNIYILSYLENTEQLTPAIRSKATNFMTSGYQRQLNYKLSNGAYSTFGADPGITWLTAFVLRCFVKAQTFIYIDPKNIEEAKSWLMSRQQPNGCFEMSGKLLNNLMKGGVSDEVTLSAYVTAAFLEMNISDDDPVLVKSLSCLKESMSDLSNTYTTALMAYVFTLAGDMETRSRLLQHLDTVAVREGGFLHWSQKAAETSASLSVEISSYVLMAKLSASPTDDDVVYSTNINRWLIKQQNSYGGFTSTQDTVVALQALALYTTVVFNPEGSSAVTLQTPSALLTFEVNQDNKLLYQERALQDVTGKFSLEVKGSACATVQISLHYNIQTPVEISNFVLMVNATPQCSSSSERPRLRLDLAALYRGNETATNMVILDVKSLSGFVPDATSVKKLRKTQTVDRVDQKDDHVLVYLRELAKGTAVSHTLDLVQEVPVENLKPAVVKIYDYYQPSDQAETEYKYFCTTV